MWNVRCLLDQRIAGSMPALPSFAMWALTCLPTIHFYMSVFSALQVLFCICWYPLIVLHNGSRLSSDSWVGQNKRHGLLLLLFHGFSAHEESKHHYTKTDKGAPNHDQNLGCFENEILLCTWRFGLYLYVCKTILGNFKDRVSFNICIDLGVLITIFSVVIFYQVFIIRLLILIIL